MQPQTELKIHKNTRVEISYQIQCFVCLFKANTKLIHTFTADVMMVPRLPTHNQARSPDNILNKHIPVNIHPLYLDTRMRRFAASPSRVVTEHPEASIYHRVERYHKKHHPCETSEGYLQYISTSEPSSHHTT